MLREINFFKKRGGGGQLYTLIAQHLAPVINLKPQDFLQELDDVHRYNTTYTKRNKLTPGIHVKFVRSYIRDHISKASQNKQP